MFGLRVFKMLAIEVFHFQEKKLMSLKNMG